LLSPPEWNRYVEGTRLGVMYDTPGCETSADIMETGDPFLVVPLVETDPGEIYTVMSGMPTFSVCAHS
jgi:hypothetical protein